MWKKKNKTYGDDGEIVPLTKQILIGEISRRENYVQADVKQIIGCFGDIVAEYIRNGVDINLDEFFSMEFVEMKERRGLKKGGVPKGNMFVKREGVVEGEDAYAMIPKTYRLQLYPGGALKRAFKEWLEEKKAQNEKQ
jgi:nucleoid DNA-binding protein